MVWLLVIQKYRKNNILLNGKLWHKIKRLKNKSYIPSPENGKSAVFHRKNIFAAYHYFTGRWRIKCAYHVKQRTFAGTGFSDDSHILALWNRQSVCGHPSLLDKILEYLEKLEAGNDYHIKIQLTDIGVKRCESEFLLARGLKIFLAGGGIIDMEIRQAALEWAADYFLPFGNNAAVPEPVELMKPKWDIPKMEQAVKRRFHSRYPARKSFQTEFSTRAVCLPPVGQLLKGHDHVPYFLLRSASFL